MRFLISVIGSTILWGIIGNVIHVPENHLLGLWTITILVVWGLLEDNFFKGFKLRKKDEQN